MSELLAGIGAGAVLGGRYELNSALGQGGMARVWSATDRLLDRRVAVKLLDTGTLDEQALERFRREARTAAALNHPNIVTVHDVGETETDAPYLVMELVRGESLAEVSRRGPLRIAQIVTIARQLCDALLAAHGAGVVHRDVKPGNILIATDGVVKVCDFGIASFTRDDSTLTEAGMAVGTAHYMAPEQARGHRAIDHRADLYALGCVIYAMATGFPPFDGDSPAAVAFKHLHQPATPLAVRRRDLPQPLAELVTALLAKDPAERPNSAADVKARLDRADVVRAESGGARKPWRGRAAVVTPPPRQPTQPIADHMPQRHRPAVVALGLIAVTVIIAGLASLLDRDRVELTTPNQPGTSSAAPAPAVPPPDDPAAALAALEAAVNAQAGAMNPDALKDLREKIREIRHELDKGDRDKAAGKLRDVQKKLTEALREGEISAAGYDGLQTPIEQLAAALPAS